VWPRPKINRLTLSKPLKSEPQYTLSLFIVLKKNQECRESRLKHINLDRAVKVDRYFTQGRGRPKRMGEGVHSNVDSCGGEGVKNFVDVRNLVFLF